MESRLRSQGGRQRRRVATFVTVLLVPVVAVAAGLSAPAGADRLDFLCSVTPSGGGDPDPTVEEEQVLENAGVRAFDGIDLVFTGHAPAGVPVAGETPDPVTGVTTFTRAVPFRFGWIGMDFLDPADVPGADGSEIVFQFEPRLASESGPLDTRLGELFHDNFGMPFDFGPLFKDRDNILLAGIDASVRGTRALKDLAPGFRAEVSVGIRWKLSDNSTSYTRVGLTFDSTTPGHEWPERAQIGVAFKHDQLDAPVDYVAVHQNVRHYDVDADVDVQPGFSMGVIVDTLDVVGKGNNVEVVGSEPLLTANTSWNHTPESFAFGIRSLCKPWDADYNSTAHFGWNVGGLADPAATTLDVDLNIGIAAGQTISIDDGGTRRTVQADEKVVSASVAGIPATLDAILHPDSLGITRSPDVVPTLDLHAFQLASDDPNTEDDLPLHVAGQIVDLPRHALLTAGFDPDGFRRVDISLWDLLCPGEPPPTGTEAPPDVQRNDIVDTLPFVPADCSRHSLSPATSAMFLMQNFLPQDLDATDATDDLATLPLAEPQFVYYAGRDLHPLSDESLYRVAARVTGATRVIYDTSEPPPEGSRMRIYVEREEPPAGDDAARVVFDLDRRTDLEDEVANQGSRYRGDVEIVDLPGTVRIDYATEPGRPADVAWRADAPLALADGTIEVQLAGDPADPSSGSLRALVRLETGQVVDALPPAGEIQVIEEAEGDATRTTVAWTAPGPTGDAFPTPVVPAYDPDDVTRIHVGAVVTTRGQREAGEQIRVHADVDVPENIAVSWASGPDGLIEAVAQLCEPGSLSCSETRLDATAVSGPPTGPDDLLQAPPLPDIPTDISAAVTPFTDFRDPAGVDGSGVRAIIPGGGVWGVDGVIRGVERFRYAPDPQDVGLVMGPTGPQSLQLNLLAVTGDPARPGVVFVDAALDAIPAQLRAVIRDSGLEGSDQPWIWLNSDDVNLSDISQVDFDSTDPAGSRPVLSGLVRVGDVPHLTADVAPPAVGKLVEGVDVSAHIDTASSRYAVQASARLVVPRHVAVWQPTLERCDNEADVATCQDHPTFEIDTIDDVTVKMATTAEQLGELNASIQLASGFSPGLDVLAHVDTVPGQLEAHVTIAENQRLPWSAYELTLDANTGLGGVWADIYDLGSDLPDDGGERIPRAVQQRRDDGSLTETVPNFAVELANVPAELMVQARIRGGEERLTPGTPDPAPGSDGGRLGYVHALVDLQPDPGGPAAAEVMIDALNNADGQLVATLHSDEPLSGFLNARMDHIKVGEQDPQDRVSAFNKYLEAGGLFGGLAGWAFGDSVARPVQITFYLLSFGLLGWLDVFLGAILGLLYSATPILEPRLDFDLPLYVEFDRVTDVRFGVSGTTFSIDERHRDGEGDPLVFGIRQRSLPHRPGLLSTEGDLSVDGAWYYEHYVRYKYDSTLEGWNFTTDMANYFGTVGIYDWHLCEGETSGPSCAVSPKGFDNVATIDDLATVPRSEDWSETDGWTSADILIDVLFTPDRRDFMENKNGGVIDTASKTFKGLADTADPLVDGSFSMPDLASASLVPSTTTLKTNVFKLPLNTNVGRYTHRYFGTCSFEDDPVPAVGADGSGYLVEAKCYEMSTTPKDRVWGVVLTAFHDSGDQRWEVRLPNPVGYETNDEGEPIGDAQCEDLDDIGWYSNRRCEIDVDVDPQLDGSVQITMVTRRGDDTIGTRRAWVDASGHPGFDLPGAALVDDFSATDLSFDADGLAVISPPGVDEGRWYEYVYGDGTRTGRIAFTSAVPDTTAHRYPNAPGTDHFLAMLLVYDDDGEVMDKEYFRISG